jgi:hypothetical protein
MKQRKKQKEREDIYYTATGEEDGFPIIFRGRQYIPAGVAEPDYPTLVSIYWDYEPANESGMPDDETRTAQDELEDALIALDDQECSFLMLVVTGNRRKEWHWYVHDLNDWMGKLNRALSEYSPFPIEIENDHQPDWTLYHNFISGMKTIP